MSEVSARPSLKRRVTLLMGALVFVNIAVWGWAFSVFAGDSLMLGTALLAYSLGLRHAVDADHIAAIDNVTRKLMQDGQRPIAVGLWFAIGHSAIVLIAATTVALAASTLSDFEAFGQSGGTIATIVSASFLFAIAIMNLTILRDVWTRFRRVARGEPMAEADADMLFSGQGPLSRLFRPLFRLIRRSWHMAPLGFLFGLGFDTATEVAILGLSGSHAADGVSLATILVFPVLFAVGMALIDTADGLVMLGAYEWAFVHPLRKLYYNMTITLVSALVALVIGGIQATALLAERFGWTSAPFRYAGALAEHFNILGFAIVGLFVVCWGASFLLYRWRGFAAMEARIAKPGAAG